MQTTFLVPPPSPEQSRAHAAMASTLPISMTNVPPRLPFTKVSLPVSQRVEFER